MKTSTHTASVFHRSLSALMTMLILTMSSHGFAQATISENIPTGVTVTDSNSGITEVKRSETINPITTTSAVNGDTPEKLIADIDVAMTSLERERDKLPIPGYSSTSEVILENLNLLKIEISTRRELINRIDAQLEQQGSPQIQENYKTILTDYRKRLSKTSKEYEICYDNMDRELKRRSKDSASQESDHIQTNKSVASEAIQPAPTPSATPWYKTETAQQKYWIIGSAAALGVIAVLQEWGKKAVDNAMK